MSDLKTKLDQFFDETVLSHSEEESLKIQFRGSGLPICSRKLMLARIWPDIKDTKEFQTNYHKAVGHAIHSVIQKTWAKQGVLWGNWRCTSDKCGVFFKHCMINKCLRCGASVDYQEIKFGKDEYGIPGQCDGVVWLEWLKAYIVVELKSRNFNIIKQYKKNNWQPYDSDIYQVSAYATMIQRKFWLPIVGRYIVWVGKPRPKPFLTWYYPGVGSELFDEQIVAKNKFEEQFAQGKVLEVEGVCKVYEDGKGCPFQAICFSTKRDELILNQYMEWKTQNDQSNRSPR